MHVTTVSEPDTGFTAQRLTGDDEIKPSRQNVQVRTEPLRDQALSRCRRLLLRGRFRPGQKLPLRPMAKELAIGLMPVRDALNTLVADGVLEITRGRTVRVPTLSQRQVVELHEIRRSLEGLATRLAASSCTPRALNRAEELIAEMEIAFMGGDYEAYIDAHFSFHFSIYSAADRPTLLNMIESLWLHLGPSFREGIERARAAYETNNDKGDPNHVHRTLLHALRARDATGACQAIETDIRTGMEVYLTGTWPTDVTITD